MPEEILTLAEVAEYLKVGEQTVYRMAREGVIPAFKVRGSWRFHRARIDRWIEAETERQAKAGQSGTADSTKG
ncbi:MAG: helix-turn-helix domain-containing protein [Pseudomonadota bacterium]